MDIQEECKHRGTMTLTPTEDKGWEVLDWCFYKRGEIEEACCIDCPYKNEPVQDWE